MMRLTNRRMNQTTRHLATSIVVLLSISVVGLLGAHAQEATPGTPPPPAPKTKEPEPAKPIPTDPSLTLPPEASAGEWQLDFVPGDLRLYTDPTSELSYWYFTYKVVNRTGQDRWWAPRIELYEDSGRLRRSGKGVSPITMKRIEAFIGNKLVQDQYQVLGEIHQGEVNAKQGFVVWDADPTTATEMSVFIRGMSSEIKRIPSETAGGAETVQYKTMKRDYRVSGDAEARGSEPVECEKTEWILR